MPLSVELARKIVQVIEKDLDSRRVIHPDAVLEKAGQYGNPLTSVLLEQGQLAGKVRNLALLFHPLAPDAETVDERLCMGISKRCGEALQRALKAGGLPGVRTLFNARRVTGVTKTWHSANGVEMDDRTEYVFDWHATLNPSNPAISPVGNWEAGMPGVNFALFRGFSY